jgi:hypothetical protein
MRSFKRVSSGGGVVDGSIGAREGGEGRYDQE